MRMTIDLPEDIHEKIALDALKKPRNSKEAVITGILRAFYGGGRPQEKRKGLLAWRISAAEARRMRGLKRAAKRNWK